MKKTILLMLVLCGCVASGQQTQYKIDEPILSNTEKRQSIRVCEEKQDILWKSQIENFRGMASSVKDGYITPQQYAELFLSIEELHRNNREMCSTIANLTRREMKEYLDSLQTPSQD